MGAKGYACAEVENQVVEERYQVESINVEEVEPLAEAHDAWLPWPVPDATVEGGVEGNPDESDDAQCASARAEGRANG